VKEPIVAGKGRVDCQGALVESFTGCGALEDLKTNSRVTNHEDVASDQKFPPISIEPVRKIVIERFNDRIGSRELFRSSTGNIGWRKKPLPRSPET
jgi:hypothetical protein